MKKMANKQHELTYKVKRSYTIDKNEHDKSVVPSSDETDTIVKRFIDEQNKIAELNGTTNNYLFKMSDIEKTAILEHWFKNEIELTELKDEASGYGKTMYTDGINKLELLPSNVYVSRVIDHDFNVINFFDKNKKRYFSCDINDYKPGDEIVALNAIMEKKAEERANRPKLTEEQKEERTETARQTAEFLGLKKLTGTKKQKDWAETIRARIIEKLSHLDAESILEIKEASSSKFWIDNRFKKLTDFENLAKQYKNKRNDPFFLKSWHIELKMSREERIQWCLDNA